MTKKGYTDDWGNERPIADLTDWSDYMPWQYWSGVFDWQPVTEILEQDVIAFRDDVLFQKPDGANYQKNGARFVIARVANLIDSTAYLVVFHSEGEQPFEPEDCIKRKLKWLAQYGVLRWPRFDGEQGKKQRLTLPHHTNLPLKSRFCDIPRLRIPKCSNMFNRCAIKRPRPIRHNHHRTP